jgi:hypothetical protein
VFVDHALGILARKSKVKKFIVETSGPQSELAVVIVNIQQPALRSRIGRRFRLVDRRVNSVDVQDARERQAAEAGTNDCDLGI